jgi:DeoR/GlpR family transcriptional regulator of sugar metabolism
MSVTGSAPLQREPDLDQAGRRQRISELVLEHGSVTIAALTVAFGVSQMTIHRDLDELEARGVLRKVRGGATAQPSSLFESSVDYRMGECIDAKRAIAEQALRHVEPGDSVILDDSTTAFRLAELVPQRAPLTVITNFLPSINLLHGQRGISLISLAGRFSPQYGAFLGAMTEASVRALRANVLFVSTAALTGGVLYHQDQEIANGKRVLMGSAARRILLVDHSKFEKQALYRVVPITDFDLVIVDGDVGATTLAALRDQVPVELAPRR